MIRASNALKSEREEIGAERSEGRCARTLGAATPRCRPLPLISTGMLVQIHRMLKFWFVVFISEITK